MTVILDYTFSDHFEIFSELQLSLPTQEKIKGIVIRLSEARVSDNRVQAVFALVLVAQNRDKMLLHLFMVDQNILNFCSYREYFYK